MQRKSIGKALALGAVGVIAVASLAACSSKKNSGGGGLGSGGGSSSGGGNAGKTFKIGFQGALSGDNQQLGINIVNAVELAVDQANAKNDLGFKLELLKSDDAGDATKAPAAAQTLIQDAGVIGVVGPIFSGPTSATVTFQSRRPVFESSATRCASSVPMNNVSPRMATPRLLAPQHTR